MKNSKFKKGLSLFLSLLMIFSMIPVSCFTSFAADEPIYNSEIKSISDSADNLIVTQKSDWNNDSQTKVKLDITLEPESHYEDEYHDLIFMFDVSTQKGVDIAKKFFTESLETIKKANQYVKKTTGIDGSHRIAVITYGTSAEIACNYVSAENYAAAENVIANLTQKGKLGLSDHGEAIYKARKLIENEGAWASRPTNIIHPTGLLLDCSVGYNMNTYLITLSIICNKYGVFSWDTVEEAICSNTFNNVQLKGSFSKYFKNIKCNVSGVTYSGNDFTVKIPKLMSSKRITFTADVDTSKCFDGFIPLLSDGLKVSYGDANVTLNFDDTTVLSHSHYSLTYDVNGATGTTPVDNTVYHKNTNAIAVQAYDLSKDGYAFSGWLNSKNEIIQPGQNILINGSDSLKATWTKYNVILDSSIISTLKAYASNSTEDFQAYRASIATVTFLDTIDKTAMNASDTIEKWDVSTGSDQSIMAWIKTNAADNTKHDLYIAADGGVKANVDSSYLFYQFTNLTEINGMEYFNTNGVTNMAGMFAYCSKLTSLDVSNFDTSNVTIMGTSFDGIFSYCRGLTSLDVSGFNTSNVTSMSCMFYHCSSLTSLDVSNFDTSKTTNMKGLFGGCSSLASIDLSSFDTHNVTDMSYMFSYYSSSTALDLTPLDTSNVTNMDSMFSRYSSPVALDLSSFDTSNVTNMGGMFMAYRSSAPLDLTHLDTSSVTNTRNMFESAQNVELDFSSFDLSNIPDDITGPNGSSQMFAHSSNITINNLKLGKDAYCMFMYAENVTLNNFDTSNVTNMKSMFSSYVGTTLDLTSWDVRNVTNAEWMFHSASLTSLNLSGWNLNNITSTERMFESAAISTINLSNIKANKVKSTMYMFMSSSATTINMTGFTTSTALTNMKSMFYYCKSLTSIDLSSFNTKQVTDMTQMFQNCSALTTIYVGDNWSTTNVSSGSSMFKDCTKLKGKKSYSSLFTGVSRATTSGYMTYKAATASIDVLGENTVLTPIEVKENDFIVYNLTVQCEGDNYANGVPITVTDKLPDGLSFVKNYFNKSDYSNAGIDYNKNNTSFVIGKNVRMAGSSAQTKNATDIISTYPTYNANTNSITATFKDMPAGTEITIRFACKVNELPDGVTSKTFNNVATYNGKLSGESNYTSHYVLATAKNMYNVTYNYTGNVPAGFDSTTVSGFEGDTVTLTNPIADGYTFNGWTVNGATVSNNSFVLNGNVTVTGNWTKNPEPVRYTVTYSYTDENNNTVTKQQSYEKDELVNIMESPNVFDYDFVGWDSNDVTINNDGTFNMPAQNITLTGKFVPTQYKITFLIDGEPYAEDTASSGTIVTLEQPILGVATFAMRSTPSTPKYIFTGWDSDHVEVVNDVNGDYVVMPSHDITLYGVTEEISDEDFNELRDVIFEWSDNSYKPSDLELNNDIGIAGGTYELPTIENTNEYRFDGWKVYDANGNEIIITDNIINVPADDTVISIVGSCTGLTAKSDNVDIYLNETKDIGVSLVTEKTGDTIKYVSADESVVTVDANGNITGAGVGETTVKITVDGTAIEKIINVRVTKQPVSGISVDKTEIELNVNESTTITATVNPENASIKNLEYESSDDTIVTVDGNGNVTAGDKAGTATITIKSVDDPTKSVTVEITVNDPITDIILPEDKDIELKPGEITNLGVTTEPADPSNKPIYESSNKDVVDVDEDGNIIAKGEGDAIITVKYPDGTVAGEITVTVKYPVEDITTNKSNITLNVGDTDKITPIITPDNATNKNVTYTSSDEAVIKVDAEGNIEAIGKGTATITITSVDDPSKFVTVSVTVNNPITNIVLPDDKDIELKPGEEVNLGIITEPADPSDKPIYESSNKDVVDVDENGNIIAKGEGEATITVKYPDGTVAGEITVIVKYPVEDITVDKNNIILNVGSTDKITASVLPDNATNKKVTYTSNNEDAVKVDADGNITAIKEGTAIITVTSADNTAVTKDITVTVKKFAEDIETDKTKYEVNLGETVDINATVKPDDATDKELTYKSNDESIATVSPDGTITPVKQGTTTITITGPDGTEKTVDVVVKQPATGITIPDGKKEITLKPGESTEIGAKVEPDNADYGLVYESSNPDIADVDENGNIIAKKDGEVTITIESKDGKVTETIKVTVRTPVDGVVADKSEVTLDVGETTTVTGTVIPNEATDKRVTYSSSNEDVATVDENGNVKAVGKGTATITITSVDDPSKFVTVSVTVNNPITNIVLPDDKDIELKPGEEINLGITTEPADPSDKPIYESSDNSVVDVDEDGNIIAKGEGEATITVKYPDGTVAGEIAVTIKVPVEGLGAEIDDSELNVGESTTITPVFTPANATNKKVTYASSDDTVVTVDNEGNVKAVGKGTATITIKSVDDPTKSVTVEITVNDPITDIILPEDKDIELKPGESTNLGVTTEPADPSNKPIYESSNKDVVDVDEDGNIIAKGEGEATITVKYPDGTVAGEFTVTVKVPVDEIATDRSEITLNKGETDKVAASVNEDATNKKLEYTTSDDKVVTVDNEGNITAIDKGTATITITSVDNPSKFVTVEITVNDPITDIILPEDKDIELKPGESTNLGVTTEPADPSDKPIYESSDNSVVDVDEDGNIIAKGEGEATITVKYPDGTIAGEITVTVKYPVEDITTDKSNITLNVGDKDKITPIITPDNATNKNVTYTSSDEAVIKVDAEGNIEAIGKGAATITITSVDDPTKSVTVSVTVNKPIEEIIIPEGNKNIELKPGESTNLGVTTEPADPSNKPIYESSNKDVVDVDEDGNIIAKGEGEATITVKYPDGTVAGEITITIKVPVDKVEINNEDTTLKVGDTDKITVTVNPSDATNKDYTFESSDNKVVKVDENGNITAVGVGTATITVTSKDDPSKKDTITITVKGYELTPDVENVELTDGDKYDLNVKVDGVITDEGIRYEVKDPGVIKIDPNTGNITAINPGTATVIATLLATSASISIAFVVKEVKHNLVADSDNITVYVGKTSDLGIKVTPAYKAPEITYTSADTSVATVSKDGKVTGVSVGTTTITAKLPDGKSKTVTVNVTLNPNDKVQLKFMKTNGIGWYEISTDGGKTFQRVMGDNTPSEAVVYVVKGSQVIIKAGGFNADYNFYVNGSSIEKTGDGTIILTATGSMVIQALTVEVPDVEESLNWFQKIIKAIKEFFQKLFGIK